VFSRIVENVDVLVGNEEDLQKALGVKGPEAGASSTSDTDAFFETIDQVVQKYPNVKVVATTLREVITTNRHTWSAVAWIEGQRLSAPTCQLDVYDRVGGGDGFASGLIYGFLNGEPLDQCVRLGWAHGALITTYPGDTTMASLEEVRAFAKGGSARIQR
jgi:2-dehydro-3-deoxygluconokinase